MFHPKNTSKTHNTARNSVSKQDEKIINSHINTLNTLESVFQPYMRPHEKTLKNIEILLEAHVKY